MNQVIIKEKLCQRSVELFQSTEGQLRPNASGGKLQATKTFRRPK
jgi:hypothetical protein